MFELSLVENAWHVVSAAAIFLLGAFIAGTQPFFRFSRTTALALYVWHTLFCIYYAYFSLTNTADAKGYFFRSYTLHDPFALGTFAIDYMTAPLTQFLGLSYLGAFLVFNIIGMLGLLAFFAAIRDVTADKSLMVKRIGLLVVFLPGVSFWSVAIGKDALTFAGTGFLCWAVLDIGRRYPAVLFALGLYLFARPHMVALLGSALALAYILGAQANLTRKLLMMILILPLAAAAIPFSAGIVGIGDEGAFENASDFLEYRQSVNTEGGSSIPLADMNIAARMFAYAFRPFFFDAEGLFGLATSAENLVLFLVSLWALSRMVNERSNLPSFARMFFVLFVLISWLVLANTTANIGLALRQKWMFMPMLLILALSYLPARAAETVYGAAPRAPGRGEPEPALRRRS